MTTTIRFHGISTYEVSGPNGRVVFDPCISGNALAVTSPDDIATPDAIVVSHAAWDHMADAASIALRTGAPVICGTDTAMLLEEQGVAPGQIRKTTNGIKVAVNDIMVKPVASAHWSQAHLADGRIVTGVPMGFVVEFEPGVTVYHFGDSAVSAEMEIIRRVHRPTVGLLGCTQPWSLVAEGAGRVASGEMSPDQAALAAELLGIRWAVATHYEDRNTPEVDEFLRLVPELDSTGGRIPLALVAGESLVVDGDSYEVRSQ